MKMITISVLINGHPILTRSATRIAGKEGEICTYKIDEGTIIKHDYNKGFVPLAKKMLDTINEKKVTF